MFSFVKRIGDDYAGQDARSPPRKYHRSTSSSRSITLLASSSLRSSRTVLRILSVVCCGVLGIEQMFDVVVISGEVGVAKPDASVFAFALHKLGVEKENAWHVGDSLRTDVAGALGAGLTAVWLNRFHAPLETPKSRPAISEFSQSVLKVSRSSWGRIR